jgi:hypothetical protein
MMNIACKCGKEMSCVFSWDVVDQLDPAFQVMVCGDCGYVCKEDLTGSGQDVWLKARKYGDTTPRPLSVREVSGHLAECDPDAVIWITTADDQDLYTADMDLVVGYEYEDQDDEMSREVARKRYGLQYLRQPILRVGHNE